MMSDEQAQFWETVQSLALEEALMVKHKYIRSEHLLLALLRMPDARAALELGGAGIGYDAVAAQVRALTRPVCAADERHELSANAARIMQTARETPDAPSRALLYTLVRQSPLVRKLLTRAGAAPEWIESC